LLIEKRERKIMKVEIGTKLIANYGAYYPTIEAVVTEIQDDGWVVFRDTNPDAEIATYNTKIENIRTDFKKPKGSPIGVFFLK
jgi:hypothetical protein